MSNNDSACPVDHSAFTKNKESVSGTSNNDWWPNQLTVEPLLGNHPSSNPYGDGFDYVAEFNTLDLNQVKSDIAALMKDSQDWWPADYGHYGPLFIRMAWHSAGTYRVSDGRGGGGRGYQRFAPLNSWPDNVNLDKARRLLWPIKKKYGRKLSWADLMILAGNVALEDMGFPTFGFAGGREDVWEPDTTYWGNETEWLANKRYSTTREADTLEDPLAAVQMGLIYVNPEGPDGNPDFKLAAADIRTTFARMAMNDEETVALIAGGHAFGKTHGAGDASQVGPEPEAVDDLTAVGLGWKNSQGKGHSEDTISSGLEVTWTTNPTQWDNDYLRLIYKYEWKLEKSPAGAIQWVPEGDVDEEDLAPHAHIKGQRVVPRMLTTDLALRFGDEEYDRISRKFLDDFDYFTDVFARAWFKLTHRDMGPSTRYHGPEVPKEVLIWQDPLPESKSPISLSEMQQSQIANLFWSSGLSISEIVRTAWAAASTYRDSDRRGGLNGARIRLQPQISWDVNEHQLTAQVIDKLEKMQSTLPFDISLADLIAFTSKLAIERAALNAGVSVEVPYVGGRSDASQELTDVESFSHLEPVADGFRNYAKPGHHAIAEQMLIEKASLLTLTPPEMTALIGGLRVLRANFEDSKLGVLTKNIDMLSNDFFVNILDMNLRWTPVSDNEHLHLYNAYEADSDKPKYTASRVDLIFASNSVLRAYAEVYASNDGQEKFVKDFVSAWHKVMMLDRFDLR